MDQAKMLQEIGTWPVDRRLKFIEEVWDRLIDDGRESPSDDEITELIDRRLAEHEADPNAGLSWEEIESYVRRPR